MTISPATKDIIVRAAKTFVQSFLATWALTNYNFEQGALIGAAAAGISALMNILVTPKQIQ